MFCADIKSGQDIFDMRGIDRDAGCMVVVRPDQYIAQVLPLDGHEQLAAYFDRFMLPRSTTLSSPKSLSEESLNGDRG
jgi:phenol 2-monooxygenase